MVVVMMMMMMSTTAMIISPAQIRQVALALKTFVTAF
jgi:hypothetical protein